jgi:hypothetical protein
MCTEQQVLGLVHEVPAEGSHWRDAAEIHHLSAVRYRDGHYRLSYLRTDMATRRMVSEDLGDVCEECAALMPPDQALMVAAATLVADREQDRLVR